MRYNKEGLIEEYKHLAERLLDEMAEGTDEKGLKAISVGMFRIKGLAILHDWEDELKKEMEAHFSKLVNEERGN